MWLTLTNPNGRKVAVNMDLVQRVNSTHLCSTQQVVSVLIWPGMSETVTDSVETIAAMIEQRRKEGG